MTATVTAMPHITTSERVKDHLLGSLHVRGVDAGPTLGTFIDAVLRLGVTLDAPLAAIEYGMFQGRSGRVVAEQNEDGWEIREAR